MEITQKAISFLPRPLITCIWEGQFEKRFEAVCAFADVSGFTKMSEQLATIGNEGAEILTSLLNNYFTQMIGSIERAGGFVGKFGGDAMTVFYPAESENKLAEIAQKALHNCVELQAMMGNFENIETKAGTFHLGMKIGISAGTVLFKMVGPARDGAREYLLAGYPLDRAAEAEHHGISGEIIASTRVAELCSIKGSDAGDGFVRVGDMVDLKKGDRNKAKQVPKKVSEHPEWLDIVKNFIDPAIYRRLALGIDSVGEIRRVSVIFMSFSGLDYDVDIDVGEKLERVYEWVFGLTQRFGGSINKVDMGDKGSKMIITFGAPTAHENNEELAVHCGMELVRGQDHIRKLGVEQKIGIASGVVFAGEVGAPNRQEYTVMGRVVNLSARIMAHSKPGQLLVDNATRKSTEKIFKYNDPESVKFKGIKKPLPVYEAAGYKDERRVLDAERRPLIGRTAEMTRIDEQIQDVYNGRMRVLVTSGVPGIGKTRIAQEVLDRCRDLKFTLAAGEALSYAKQFPYLIWNSVFRKLMGLPSVGGGGEAISNIELAVREADPRHIFRTPIIADVLGFEYPDNEVTEHFDAQLRQENLFDFTVEFIKHHSNKSPLLLLFEDCQWIDKSSLELIAYLMRCTTDNPLLIILVKRDDRNPAIDAILDEIIDNEGCLLIKVKELDRNDTELLILDSLNAQSVDADLVKFTFNASHGNPSFTEQLLINLRSEDRIRLLPDSEAGGVRAEKVGKLSDFVVPDSVASLIMSQLDRLGPEAKLSIQLAAVIGHQFEEEILTKSYPVRLDDAVIKESIAELQRQEIIRYVADNETYDYIFKNLLTIDVAYDSLLFAHRREYHRRIGLSLEGLHAESLKEWYEALARHFYFSEDSKKAVLYLGKSGDKAYYIFANDSAEDYFTRALERNAIKGDLAERYLLLSMRSKVHAITGKIDGWKVDLDARLEVAQQLSDLKGQADTLDFMARYYHRVNNLEEMSRTIDHARGILAQMNYPFGEININSKSGTMYFVQNEYDKALEYWNLCASQAGAIDDQKGLSSALSNCGLVHKALGDYQRSLEFYKRSIAIDRKINNLKSESVNLGNMGVLHHRQGDLDSALKCYLDALEIARNIGSKQLILYYLGNLGGVYQHKGQSELALETYEESLKISTQNAYPRGEWQALGNMGAWYFEHAEFDKAESYYMQALGLAEKIGLKAMLPTVTLNLGQVCHYKKDLIRAREYLRKALELSIEARSKPAEDFARRYLGYVYIDLKKYKLAEQQFTASLELAESIGAKGGIASSKIGLGWIHAVRHPKSKLKKGKDRKLIDEGINLAQQAADTETVILGKVTLARLLIERNTLGQEALPILKSAREIALSSGHLCDLGTIEGMILGLSVY